MTGTLVMIIFAVIVVVATYGLCSLGGDYPYPEDEEEALREEEDREREKIEIEKRAASPLDPLQALQLYDKIKGIFYEIYSPFEYSPYRIYSSTEWESIIQDEEFVKSIAVVLDQLMDKKTNHLIYDLVKLIPTTGLRRDFLTAVNKHSKFPHGSYLMFLKNNQQNKNEGR